MDRRPHAAAARSPGGNGRLERRRRRARSAGTDEAAASPSGPRSAPERSYVFGDDPQGGVSSPRDFYYDSEIYDAKLYAVTDRPLYRPGDTVFVKLLGRAFRSARDSTPLPRPDRSTLQRVRPERRSRSRRQTLRSTRRSRRPTPASGCPTTPWPAATSCASSTGRRPTRAAFRVAEYQKPHFEISVVPDKRDFKTGEESRRAACSSATPTASRCADAKVRAHGALAEAHHGRRRARLLRPVPGEARRPRR